MGNDELGVIMSDLRRFKIEDAYKPARKLRKDGTATYEKDSDFSDYLKECGKRKTEFIEHNVSRWVKAHEIKAKYSVGTRLMKKKDMFPSFMRSSHFGIKILSIDADHAEYTLKVYGKYHYETKATFDEVERGFEQIIIGMNY
jgi:hypothetical protein